MNLLTLQSANAEKFASWLTDRGWLIACLCARWCDSCEAYRATFSRLAERHPDKKFVWIDIEDQAALVGEMEIDNFPTLLMQRAELVTFFGPLAPALSIVDGVLVAQTRKTLEELRSEVLIDPARRAWQLENNLRIK